MTTGLHRFSPRGSDGFRNIAKQFRVANAWRSGFPLEVGRAVATQLSDMEKFLEGPHRPNTGGRRFSQRQKVARRSRLNDPGPWS